MGRDACRRRRHGGTREPSRRNALAGACEESAHRAGRAEPLESPRAQEENDPRRERPKKRTQRHAAEKYGETAMTNERIGKAAGVVWGLLAEIDDGRTVAQIKKQAAGFSGDEVVAAIGWLAREGKLAFQTQGRKTAIALSTAEPVY